MNNFAHNITDKLKAQVAGLAFKRCPADEVRACKHQSNYSGQSCAPGWDFMGRNECTRITTPQRMLRQGEPSPARSNRNNNYLSSMKLKFPNLIGLLAFVALVALLFAIHVITGSAAIALVVLYQLTALAFSCPRPPKAPSRLSPKALPATSVRAASPSTTSSPAPWTPT